jgi:NAD(P)-dependent dehydrogenase (short-subunit alcohol dehydrogenase family)
MGLLDGDTALVTGAASGIGRGIARALAGEGAQLVISDLSEGPGQRLADELSAKFIAADLSDKGAAPKLVRGALSALGKISIFVHSASPRRHEAEAVPAVTEDQWDAMLTVGLRSGFFLGQSIGAHMSDARIRGRMLYITSLHASSPRNLPHYSATKAGQTMVVKELAKAFGPSGIRVNAIAPGAIPGGGFDAPAGMAEMIALRRAGTPEDIANMAVALLCDRFSGYVTGTTVTVDGGLSLYNWIGSGAP